MKLTTFEINTPWDAKLKVTGRENTNDTNTLISCLQEDEYKIHKLRANGGVTVDLGAHIGGVTLALASKGFEVISVEMLPENVELIKSNIAANGLDDGCITVCRAAVVGYKIKLGDEITAYYTDPSTEFGQAHKFIGTVVQDKFIGDTDKHGETIKVPLVSLESLLKGVEVVEFMKVDIEGAEWEVIKDTPVETLKKIKRIAVEIEGLEEETSTTEFLKLLPDCFEDVSKDYFPKWCSPGKIIHGYFINKDL